MPSRGKKNRLMGRWLKKVKNSKTQRIVVWNFGPVEITRLDGRGVDVWMVGVRTDKPGAIKFWFIRSKLTDGAQGIT